MPLLEVWGRVEGGKCRESKKRDLEFENSNAASQGADEKYTRQRAITKTPGLSGNRNSQYKPTTARRLCTWLRSAENLPGSASHWPHACAHTPSQLQA